MRGKLVVLVAGMVTLATDARANEPDPYGPCAESTRRADAAATSTIVARPIAVAPAAACPASGMKPARGCVVGVVRHGATCAPMAGVHVELGIPTRKTVVTDDTGAYRACGLRRGEHELLVPVIGAVKKIRAGQVVDVDSTFLGDLGIRLAVTSVVTFEIDHLVAGPAIVSPARIYVQTTPPSGAESEIDLEDVQPAPTLGVPIELRVARDPATGVLVSESCWMRTSAAADAGATPRAPAPEAAPATPAPPPPPPRSTRSCAHCGAADPATALTVAAALLGMRRRRR